jgi:hypothetical protein
MLKRLSLALLLACATLLAADVTGNWNASVETDAGSGTPKFVFKQSGETLTGSYAGQLGEAPITGTVKGDDIEFSFKVSPQGDAVTIKYKGKISGNQIKGTCDLGGLGSGTFTASKQ